MTVSKKGLGVGWKLAAVAAAAAGAYYFYGKNGTKHRRQLKSWTVKAKGEIMEKLENASDLSDKTYHKVVDEVLNKYKKVKTIAPGELTKFSKELKGHWKGIKSDLVKAAKNTVS